LLGIYLKSGLLGGSLLLALEVTANTDAMQTAFDAERENAIPILKPGDGVLIFRFHA